MAQIEQLSRRYAGSGTYKIGRYNFKFALGNDAIKLSDVLMEQRCHSDDEGLFKYVLDEEFKDRMIATLDIGGRIISYTLVFSQSLMFDNDYLRPDDLGFMGCWTLPRERHQGHARMVMEEMAFIVSKMDSGAKRVMCQPSIHDLVNGATKWQTARWSHSTINHQWYEAMTGKSVDQGLQLSA